MGLDSDLSELRVLIPINAVFSQAPPDILLSGIVRPVGYPEHGDQGEGARELEERHLGITCRCACSSLPHLLMPLMSS